MPTCRFQTVTVISKLLVTLSEVKASIQNTPSAVIIVPVIANSVIASILIVNTIAEVQTGPATWITLSAAILLVCVFLSRLPGFATDLKRACSIALALHGKVTFDSNSFIYERLVQKFGKIYVEREVKAASVRLETVRVGEKGVSRSRGLRV